MRMIAHQLDNFDTALPDVSIILPVLNGARFINEALASILAQTHRNFEILVLDGGSTDGTQSIVATHIERDIRIFLFELADTGLVTRLNEGLRKARGRFIARMDADDIAAPHRIELQLSAMIDDPRLVLLGSAVTVMNENGQGLRMGKYPLSDSTLREALLETCPFSHPSTLFVKESAIAAGGYRSAYEGAEDHDLWLRLSIHGRLSNLPEPLLRYRRHAAAMSAVHTVKQALASACAVHHFMCRQDPDKIRIDDWQDILPTSLEQAMQGIAGKRHRRAFTLNYHRSLFYSEALRQKEGQKILAVFIRDWNDLEASNAENTRYAKIIMRAALQLCRFKQYSSAISTLIKLLVRLPINAFQACISR